MQMTGASVALRLAEMRAGPRPGVVGCGGLDGVVIAI